MKGFFEILLLLCVKVAQISKSVAAKSDWTSWGEGGGFFPLYESKVLLLSHCSFQLNQ